MPKKYPAPEPNSDEIDMNSMHSTDPSDDGEDDVFFECEEFPLEATHPEDSAGPVDTLLDAGEFDSAQRVQLDDAGSFNNTYQGLAHVIPGYTGSDHPDEEHYAYPESNPLYEASANLNFFNIDSVFLSSGELDDLRSFNNIYQGLAHVITGYMGSDHPDEEHYAYPESNPLHEASANIASYEVDEDPKNVSVSVSAGELAEIPSTTWSNMCNGAFE